MLLIHFNWLLTGEELLAEMNFPYTTLFALLLLANVSGKVMGVAASLGSLSDACFGFLANETLLYFFSLPESSF